MVSPRTTESPLPSSSLPPQGAAATTGTSASVTSGGDQGGQESGGQSWEFRLSVASEVGEFLRGSLEGSYRGPSGRDKIKAKSRIYLLIRDWEGQVFTKPVKLFKSWRALRPLVERAEGFGSSVFVGLPSEREARAAVQAAGFSWPAED